jgi:hypothetical protein
MSTKGWRAIVPVAVVFALSVCGCGDSKPFSASVQSISFLTETVPPADAGRLYNVVVAFASEGGAALPDRFELVAGVLPAGVTLDRDREDVDLDGLPDEDGDYTGNARLLGVPRQRGSYSFTIKAISTGDGGATPNPAQPDLAVTQPFSVNVGEGTIAILTPTAQEGTSDPAVPAFPAVVSFVNPANPEAFFSFPFLIAGGSNNNLATIYGPREWELSAFDVSVDPSDASTLRVDVDESSVPGAPANLSKFEQNFADGGVFVLQAGQQKVQLGGFQSPRGPVREDGPDAGDDIGTADPAFMASLLPDWFQEAGTPKNSRRDFADTQNLSGGDNTLGTDLPVIFTDYFDPGYESTTPPFAAKYPFTQDQYLNAFFVPYTAGVNLTPLSYRLIVEAVDTRGTPTNKLDDVIARKAYVVQVQIPDITVDTILLPAGQAGVLYTAQIAISGGVPPLFTDLEWVDGNNDLMATSGDPLTKDLFGVELDPRTWMFIGAPRAAAPDTVPATTTPDGPSVELTVRAWAQVMNPTQTGPALVPTGNAGERDGLLDPDGGGPAPAKSGRHHTYQVNFALPTAPSISNASLRAGIDGQAYPGDRIVGTGGVPLLAPYPPGFFDMAPGATYPSATAQRAYRWSSTYAQDLSFDPPLGPGKNPAAPGLPNTLTLVETETLATNGNITGTPFDRGFHPVQFTGLDFYVGNVATVPPSATAYQTVFQRTLALSISPDQAGYLRGVQASEGTGGVATGLLDSTAQMAEVRMTPIMLAAGLFSVDTGKTPVRFAGLPTQFDTLPVLLVNGGSDNHNRMSIPQIRGYWPAEQNKETQWYYYAGLGADQAWKHLQQEFTWIQSPDANHTRVFMWAEAPTILSYNSSTWNQRFQQLDFTKKRGVMILNPRTGRVHVPAILNPAADADHGVLFGAEFVTGGRNTASTGSYNYIESGLYMKYYYYNVRDSQHDRQAHLHGGSTYLQTYSSTNVQSPGGYYMNSIGRTATSVAMSMDGKWCATAIVGAPTQTILLWRTDNQPIPAAILGLTYAEGVPGMDEDGVTAFSNRAVLLKVGGQSASGTVITSNQRYLLPDSIMFVENGILFLNETQLDRVFGVSLIDGHLSSISINAARAQVNGAGVGPTVSATAGQFIPDNDCQVGCVAPQTVGTQYSFAGNKTAAGEEGPNKVAFVAGAAGVTGAYGYLMGGFRGALSDLTPATSYPRQGYASAANADMSLYYMALSTTGATGLEVSASTLRDLTGNDPDVTGDLLTPGRFGEELDRLVLSDDGNYVAVVREQMAGGTGSGVGYGVGGYMPSSLYGYYGSFAGYYPYILTSTTGQYDHWFPTQDLLVVSTDGSDMHSGTSGTQHVLFLGTGQQYTSAKGGMPTYAVQQPHLNAEGRRIHSLQFAPDGRRLIINYAGGTYYNPASGYGTGTNWQPFNPSYTSYGVGDEISLSFAFRTSAGGPVDFTSGSNITNNLSGLTGTSSIGQTTTPIGETTAQQCFWATFRSENGNFLYYISDQIDANLSFLAANRNHMVGFNITAAAINGRNPFTPFSTHPATVGFEQFDCNAWSYENRFAASPGGIASGTGQDAKGILCVIGSDASAGAGTATDLEVYVMNTNLGTNLTVLTSAVTTGTANAINHLYLSADGNVLAGQISRTAASSAGSRAVLNSNNDLFVVRNIQAVLGGAAPSAFIVSAAQSHGATVAFVGDGTSAGPQAIVFSAAPSSSSNTSWATRTLKAAPIAPGAVPTVLDSTTSHYAVLSGGRKLNDNATTAD